MKTIECVVNGVKVEAGQWWMTKGGKILYVVGINPFDDFPIWVYDIEDADVTVTYRHNGVSFEEPEDSLHRHLQFCTGFDWAGDGYRLLNVETDVAALGDEIWDYNNNKWKNREICDGCRLGTAKTDFYRRKIEPTEPVCEAGYRWLKSDEVIEATDQFKDCFNKQWRNPLFSMGSKAGCVNTWRRPIKPEPAPAPVEYRMLQVGEVIEKGDEYLGLGEWDITTRPGGDVGEYQVDNYRRKIDPTKDRYFVFKSGLGSYIKKRPNGTMVDFWYDGKVIDVPQFTWSKMHDDYVATGQLIECSEDYAKQHIAKK